MWHPKNGWVQMARNVIYTLSEDARSLLQFIEAEKSDNRVEEKGIQIIDVSRGNDESTEREAAKQKGKPRIPRTPEETFLSEGLAVLKH